jgi:hypothetical protein
VKKDSRNGIALLPSFLVGKYLLITAVALLFTGVSCVSVQPLPRASSYTERHYTKNYKIGELQSIYVGEEVIKFRDYYVVKTASNKLQASKDFLITGPNYSYSGAKGDLFPILGMSDGRYVIQFPGVNAGFFIDPSGKFLGNAFSLSDRSPLLSMFKVEPSDTRFPVITVTSIDTSRSFSNYEIVFTGRTKDSINFLYREYTPDDLAKPAFYQNLTYEPNTKFIRFRKFRIEIIEVGQERLTYRVLEDGHELLK